MVVGDVVGSRRVEDRSALRGVLADGIDGTNEALGTDLVAPFAALKGVDEVGGVLRTLAGSYRAIRTLVEATHPAEIRFAVVWGEVDAGVDEPDVASQDGPAFHRADDLLAAVARRERYVGLDVQGAPQHTETGGDDAGVDRDSRGDPGARTARGARTETGTRTDPGERIDGGVRHLDPYLATIADQMDLLCTWKAGWTERQAEVVRHYREADTMAAVAEDLDVTVQTVSKTLRRAEAQRIVEVEGTLEATMAHLAAEVSE